MKDALKYIAVIIVCGTVIVLVSQLRCGDDGSHGGVTVIPSDSNFTAVTHKTYQPPSLPFSKKSSGVKLPAGVREKDVQRIISVEVRDVPKQPPKRIDVIELKSGEVFVHKDSSIASVAVTSFEPQVVSFRLRFGLGIAAGKKNDQATFGLVALFAPVEWYGWLHVPVIAADLDGVGIGAQAQVYHSVFVGAARLWRYDEGTQAKIFVSYVF